MNPSPSPLQGKGFSLDGEGVNNFDLVALTPPSAPLANTLNGENDSHIKRATVTYNFFKIAISGLNKFLLLFMS